MSAIASQIISLTIVCSTVYLGADQRKHQSSTCHWPLCGEIPGYRWFLRTNDQLCGTCFHLMTSSYQRVGVVLYWTCRFTTAAASPLFISGPLFTKRPDVLLQDLVKSRSREIGCYDGRIALQFDRHLGSAAADVPVKLQSYWKSLNPNLAASGLREILR